MVESLEAAVGSRQPIGERDGEPRLLGESVRGPAAPPQVFRHSECYHAPEYNVLYDLDNIPRNR